MDTGDLATMPEDLRQEAQFFRRRGQEDIADLLDSVADDIERRMIRHFTRLVTLEEAVEISGYSYSTLQRRVGKDIPNRGEGGDPRVMVADLPYKSGFLGRRYDDFVKKGVEWIRNNGRSRIDEALRRHGHE